MTTDAAWHVPGSPGTRIMGEEIKEAIVNQDYIATVVSAIFATALACMVNLYAPLPDVVRHFNWVIVALGPFLFLAIAMASNPETDGGDQLDFRA